MSEIPGFRARTTARGLRVIELDYWADPARDDAWAEQAKRRSTSLAEYQRNVCVQSNARILTEDLRWIEAGDLKTGDRILGFDEDLSGYFRYRPSVVESIAPVEAPGTKVYTTRGSVTVTAEHRFIVWTGDEQRDEPRHRWCEAQNLRSGDRLVFIGEPWSREETREAGWLAGMMDGEGSVEKTGREVKISQNDGPLIGPLVHALESRGFEPYVRKRASYFYGKPTGNTMVTIGVTGRRNVLRLLGSIRPERLLGKLQHDGVSVIERGPNRLKHYVEVCKTVPIESKSFLSIQTSTKTFISDGFFSHNCRNWNISGGTGVYAEFTEIGREHYIYEPPTLLKLPVYRGWDFGRRHPACVWLQYAPKSDRVYVLREFEVRDIAPHHFRDSCRYFSGQMERADLDSDTLGWVQMQENLPGMPKPPWFPKGTIFLDLAGPEVNNVQSIASRDPREATLRQVWAAGGIEFSIHGGPVKARVEVLRRLLYLRADGRPGILISPYCPAVAAMLDGGLSYKRATMVRPEQDEVRKDGQHDDVHDALTYCLVGVVPAEGMPGVTPGMAEWPGEENLGWTV